MGTMSWKTLGQECPSYKCHKIMTLGKNEDHYYNMEILKAEKHWLFVKLNTQNKSGWIYKYDLEGFE